MTARKCGEGVGRVWLCLSDVEVGGVHLRRGGVCANLVLVACISLEAALVGQWEFGYCCRPGGIGFLASPLIPRRCCVGWVGIRRKCVIARKCGEGVGRVWICMSGVEVGGVYLGGGGVWANLVVVACILLAEALVGQWDFGYCCGADGIGLSATLLIPRRCCVGWFAFSSEWVVEWKCGEGVGGAWMCMSVLEVGGVYLGGGGVFANFVLMAWGMVPQALAGHW